MKSFFCGLFILLMLGANAAAETRTQLITLGDTSNIYAKTLLFYLPLANSSSLEHSWILYGADRTFTSIVTIDKNQIYDKPVIHDIFTSDFFLRVSNIPYKNVPSGKIVLPATIRMNQTIIERNVTFRIKHSNGRIKLTGRIEGLRISDIRGGDYYPKRQRWKIPLIIDLNYAIDRIDAM